MTGFSCKDGELGLKMNIPVNAKISFKNIVDERAENLG